MDEKMNADLIQAREMLERERAQGLIISEIKEALQQTDKEIEAMTKIELSELSELSNKMDDSGMLITLRATLSELKELKPDKRSERSRSYAIVITEMEKVYAYFKVFVMDAKGK